MRKRRRGLIVGAAAILWATSLYLSFSEKAVLATEESGPSTWRSSVDSVLGRPRSPLGLIRQENPALGMTTGGVVGVWVAEGLGREWVRLLNPPNEEPFPVFSPGGVSFRDVEAATVVVKGKVHDVVTNAATVGELLSAMRIDPDRNDEVSSPLQTPLPVGEAIRVVDVEVRTEVVQSSIPFHVITRYSEKLEPGVVRILRRGVPGLVAVVYSVRLEDGKVAAREVIEGRLLRSPVAEERLVGVARNHGARVQVGEASWYYHPGLTAAHPWLPFGTVVTVTNLANGKSVTVVINDRGPFGGRIIDLSREAFARIAPLGQGVARVRITW